MTTIRAELKRSLDDQRKENVIKLRESLDKKGNKAMDAITETGASAWLSALPMDKYGFRLNKQEFRDALRMRYNIPLENLPTTCVCGKSFDFTHAFSCPNGGFVITRHDEIRDTTAAMLDEVCREVTLEPELTPLTGETFSLKSANKADDARSDIAVRSFWSRGTRAFLDVRIFNPLSKVYATKSTEEMQRKNENDKKRQYNERIVQVEMGTFTPLVF